MNGWGLFVCNKAKRDDISHEYVECASGVLIETSVDPHKRCLPESLQSLADRGER